MVGTRAGVDSVKAQSCSSAITLPWLWFLAAPASLQAPHSPSGEGLLQAGAVFYRDSLSTVTGQGAASQSRPGHKDERGKALQVQKIPQGNSWELLQLPGWVCSSGEFSQVLQWQQSPVCTTSGHWGHRAGAQPRCPQSSSCPDSGRKSPLGAGLDYHSCIPHGCLFLHLQKQMLHLLKSPRNQQLCSKTSSESSSTNTAPAGLILLA